MNESLAVYLASIPDANEECFDKVIAEIKRIRLKNVNLECKDLITKAKITWQGNQNLAGAKEVSKFLMVVPRSEACYTEIDAIF
ncbi:MAG: hypothetical protein IPO23_13390 [Flavobacterium sp.]|nr:hypothetical protein [Flavobacterium sp.]